MKWIAGKVLDYLVNHRGFREWVRFQSRMETSHIIDEYISYCKAHDEEPTLRGYSEYINYKVRG